MLSSTLSLLSLASVVVGWWLLIRGLVQGRGIGSAFFAGGVHLLLLIAWFFRAFRKWNTFIKEPFLYLLFNIC